MPKVSDRLVLKQEGIYAHGQAVIVKLKKNGPRVGLEVRFLHPWRSNLYQQNRMKAISIGRMSDSIGSPVLPRLDARLERHRTERQQSRRFNEGHTLQVVGSMVNHCDEGVLWRPWGTSSPRSASNGEELVRGGTWTEGFDNTPQRYFGLTNCKQSIVDRGWGGKLLDVGLKKIIDNYLVFRCR